MIQKEGDGMRWLEFELLAGMPVIHGCFTRHGARLYFCTAFDHCVSHTGSGITH